MAAAVPPSFRLAQAVTCHAWNADRSKIAVCPNDTKVFIFSKQGDEWVKEAELDEHDKLVTGIDWGHSTNRIVTCGQDRNAYVWEFLNGVWKPTLVILRINRAATDVKWSPQENKFAVASGSKCVSVCYFEKDNNWWVSKHIKKHKSTVLSIDWHPNNVLLLTAASDFKARVVSTWIKGVDGKPGMTPYGDRLPFGAVLAEYPASGWVHSVSFSPSGNYVAFVSHDSTITFIDLTNGGPGEATVIRCQELPFLQCFFARDDVCIATGHSFYPLAFYKSANGWDRQNLDAKTEAGPKQAQGARKAFDLFQAKVETGQDTKVKALDTKHKNTVSCVRGFRGTPGNYQIISTTGMDGSLCFWKV